MDVDCKKKSSMKVDCKRNMNKWSNQTPRLQGAYEEIINGGRLQEEDEQMK
jgi:hypothetical protein